MSTSYSFSNFLCQDGKQIYIFDMGRRVTPIDTDTFNKVERGDSVYPSPYLHQAWIALLLYNPKNTNENMVWFLKLPLDEQGFLVQAARDDILQRLLASADTEQDPLKDNPFSFKPEAEKMAIFHAQATLAMQQPASKKYSQTQVYLADKEQYPNWQELSYQGLADVVIRQQQDQNSQLLSQAISQLPLEVYSLVCTYIENIEPQPELFTALSLRLEKDLKQKSTSSNMLAVQARALSYGSDEVLKKELLTKLLKHPSSNSAEVLTAIATRCLSSLKFPDFLKDYLECLVKSELGQPSFSRILADLMFLPDLRALILYQVQRQQMSKEFIQAWQTMFSQQLH